MVTTRSQTAHLRSPSPVKANPTATRKRQQRRLKEVEEGLLHDGTASDETTTDSDDARGRTNKRRVTELIMDDADIKGPSQLSWSDKSGIVTLLVLYAIQGVPLGLAFGSVPFLLNGRVSLTDMGTFSLAVYPYSLKLFWSPIVDSYFSDTVGRRRSWIIPMQTLSGFLFMSFSYHVDELLSAPTDVMTLTAVFTVLIFLAATQDIAVDGWALTMLSKENVHHASTCQNVGQTAGYLVSFTVFLALNEPSFCQKYLGSTSPDTGLITLSGYLWFWGVTYLVVTALIAVLKTEKPYRPEDDEEDISVGGVYRSLFKVVRLKSIFTLLCILLTFRVAVSASDAISALRLIDKGFGKEKLALFALLQFPIDVVFSLVAGRWSKGPRPLRMWLIAGALRIVMAAVVPFLVYHFPTAGETGEISLEWYAIIVVASSFTNLLSTMQFVAAGAFFVKISDPSIGGTYLTLIFAVLNMGGSWPKYFVLVGADVLTDQRCTLPGGSVVGAFSCSTAALKEECIAAGNTCVVHSDGYYTVCAICVVLGTVIYIYSKQFVERLQALPEKEWRCNKGTLINDMPVVKRAVRWFTGSHR